MILASTFPRVHMFDFYVQKVQIFIEGEGGKPPSNPQDIHLFKGAPKKWSHFKQSDTILHLIIAEKRGQRVNKWQIKTKSMSY